MNETDFVQELARLLDHFRRRERRTYRALARQIGIGHVTVWRVCTGQTPHPSFWLVTRLRVALRIPRQEWFDIFCERADLATEERHVGELGIETVSSESRGVHKERANSAPEGISARP